MSDVFRTTFMGTVISVFTLHCYLVSRFQEQRKQTLLHCCKRGAGMHPGTGSVRGDVYPASILGPLPTC